VLLQPALDDLKADARRSPEGRRPGWEVLSEHGYRARPLAGWKLVTLAIPLLAFLTSFQMFRLFLDPGHSLTVTAVLCLLVLAWLFLRGLSNLE
jgi:hypothetical protein